MSYKEELNNQPPLPLEPLPRGSEDERRLWIGNLDPRVTDLTYYSTAKAPWQASRGAMHSSHTTTSVPKEDLERHKPEILIPALSGTKTKSDEKKASPMTKIQEIEAKLQRMQNSSQAFNLTATASKPKIAPKGPLVVPGMVLYKPQPQLKDKAAPYNKNDRRHHRHRR
ncbi:Hypothetical predicted protein [Cloeon dipterum]|uniref:Uncharacterized protein n=1 Tax=Cloeon dipterum TaxID=197152 RepID=A0A8S1DHE2_9INSE|nr:Hypothetical predicted protein [Cloeon dipterum]